jgi:hypothetical protein
LSASAPVASRNEWRSPLLRAALAVPLLYVLFQSLPRHWSWVFPSDQATGFYAVNGLLFFIPIVVWCLALVLLALGSANRIAWVVAVVAGALVAAYGLLAEFSVSALDSGLLAQLRIHSLNSYLAFGLYVALLGAWQLTGRGERTRGTMTEPQA